MTEQIDFTSEERERALALYDQLKERIASSLKEGDEQRVRQQLLKAIEQGQVKRDFFGLNPIVNSLQTALLAVDEIGLRRDAVLAILLYPCIQGGMLSIDEVKDVQVNIVFEPEWTKDMMSEEAKVELGFV